MKSNRDENYTPEQNKAFNELLAANDRFAGRIKKEVKTTHTPGPWHIEARAKGIDVYAIFGRNDQHVAKVDGSDNARLIAAAPELLGMLYDVESALDGEEDSVKDEHRKLIKRLKSTIAKAEGKS